MSLSIIPRTEDEAYAWVRDEMHLRKIVAAALRWVRRQKNYSQVEMAATQRMRRARWWQLENAQVDIRLCELVAVAVAANVTLDELMAIGREAVER